MTRITGTLIWYANICRREAWLMAHGLNPDEDDPYLELGRFIGGRSYPRSQRREISLPGMKADLIETDEGEHLLVEVKKSSRYVDAARLQLLFYLSQLEAYGIEASGEIRIPKERKRIPVILDAQGRSDLDQTLSDLQQLTEQAEPPPARWIPFCRACAYKEFCWSHTDPSRG
ncbi:MAG: CRISPR-associated protein Cas4 [Salinibacter sp.]